jgi:hypothetical protein
MSEILPIASAALLVVGMCAFVLYALNEIENDDLRGMRR